MYEICCMRATYFSKMCCMCATLYELDFGAVLGHVATVRNRPVRDSKNPERGQRQVSTPPLRTAAAFSRLQFVSPLRLLLPLTADTRVTLKEFDCRHLQAAFTHTEDYFTAIDAFLKAH